MQFWLGTDRLLNGLFDQPFEDLTIGSLLIIHMFVACSGELKKYIFYIELVSEILDAKSGTTLKSILRLIGSIRASESFTFGIGRLVGWLRRPLELLQRMK